MRLLRIPGSFIGRGTQYKKPKGSECLCDIPTERPKCASIPSEPLFLKILFFLIYFTLYSQQIHAFQGDRTAVVAVYPPYEEQLTEERN